MQLVSMDIGNGKLVVYVNPETTKIPIPEQVELSTGEITKLDTEEKKKSYYKECVLPNLQFNVETYDTLNSHDPEAWGIVFKSPNLFLNTLTDKEQLSICMAFVAMRQRLQFMSSNTMINDIDTIGELLVILDNEIDLVPKLIDFVTNRMPLPNLDNAGERPHDTDEMTFRRPHMIELTSIAVLCKLLTPIFGQFFWQYKKNINIDNSIKEVHCASILFKIFKKRYNKLILKLNNFVANTVLQHYKKKDDIISAYGGNTAESHALMGEATVFSRKFITVDLYKPDGNLMTYITVCLNHSVETQYKTPASKKIQERNVNSVKDTIADEGNASRMETESIATSKTADVPVIAKWSASYLVRMYKSAMGIPDEIWESAMAYYRMNLPPMTPLSNYLLCTFFGKAIGGAMCISMLPATIYVELSVILQYLMIRKGYHGLAHAMMIIPLNRKKSILTTIDNRVRMTWSSNYSFMNLKKRFPIDIGSTECTNKLKSLVEFLTTNIHSFNTAPVFWEEMNDENMNGREYSCTPDIMENLCDFIIYITDTQYGYKDAI